MKHPSYTNIGNSQSGFRTRQKYSPEDRKISRKKVDIYLSYPKIIKNIKKYIIKLLTQEIGQNLANAEKYNPILFNELFWNLDYKVSLYINNREFDLKNANSSSPFLSLLDLARDFPSEQRVHKDF